MKFKILIAFVFFLVSILFCAGNLQAQKLVSGGKPEETTIANYVKSSCVNLQKNFRICKVKIENEEWKAEFVIQKNLKTLKTMDAPFYAGSTTDDFWAYWGDLDKDGSPEIVISSLETVSNGLGVPLFYVHIFHDPLKFGFDKSLTFPIEEFGEKGNFIYDARNNETLILVTEWDNRRNLDPKRGWGLYLVGRWFRYRNGFLKPAFDKPTLARRLLFSFERERWNTIGDSADNSRPYLWLKNSKTHKYYAEPSEGFQLISKQFGVIEKYEAGNPDEQESREFTVRLRNGEKIFCRFGFPDFADEEKYQGKISIGDFGILPQKYIFPYNLSPLTIFDKLEGKRVKIETYKDDFNRDFSYFWFLEK